MDNVEAPVYIRPREESHQSSRTGGGCNSLRGQVVQDLASLFNGAPARPAVASPGWFRGGQCLSMRELVVIFVRHRFGLWWWLFAATTT